MRRKIICLALAACLACGILGGCSSNNAETSSEPVASGSEDTTSSLMESMGDFYDAFEEKLEVIGQEIDIDPNNHSHVDKEKSRELAYLVVEPIGPKGDGDVRCSIEAVVDYESYALLGLYFSGKNGGEFETYINYAVSIIDPSANASEILKELEVDSFEDFSPQEAHYNGIEYTMFRIDGENTFSIWRE